jgi:methylenetetrahydrofolate reductase (NADPH)
MRLSQIFKDSRRPCISFEVFPPRNEKAEEGLRATLAELVSLRPTYITVTYGAMGSTRDKTLDIAAHVHRAFGLPTACHLTCVGSTVAEIDAILDRIRASGVENIVALRGDPPKGEGVFVPPEGGFSHANELVAHIRRRGEFGIAVAGYPEKHIEAPDFESDLRYLRQKVDAGADAIITQLFYDNEDFFAFERRVRALGIAVPIVPGLLPVVSGKQIRKIAGMCGARIPAELGARLDAAGDDEGAAGDVGTEWALAQARGLLDRGVPGIHFYVLNRSGPITRIFEALRADSVLS